MGLARRQTRHQLEEVVLGVVVAEAGAETQEVDPIAKRRFFH